MFSIFLRFISLSLSFSQQDSYLNVRSEKVEQSNERIFKGNERLCYRSRKSKRTSNERVFEVNERGSYRLRKNLPVQ